MNRAAIAVLTLGLAGCAGYETGPSYGPVYTGGPYTGGPYNGGPVYGPAYGGPPYGGGYYPPPPPPPGWYGYGPGPGWNRPPPGGPGLLARQEQYNRQITQQQNLYNSQITAAQQRYNEQVSANPAGAAYYRQQMDRQTAQAQRQLQDNAGTARRYWLGN
jgi:hypothetical protein